VDLAVAPAGRDDTRRAGTSSQDDGAKKKEQCDIAMRDSEQTPITFSYRKIWYRTPLILSFAKTSVQLYFLLIKKSLMNYHVVTDFLKNISNFPILAIWYVLAIVPQNCNVLVKTYLDRVLRQMLNINSVMWQIFKNLKKIQAPLDFPLNCI
jgi:hypothetical protein